jgi:hypothetical protein
MLRWSRAIQIRELLKSTRTVHSKLAGYRTSIFRMRERLHDIRLNDLDCG